MNGILFEPHYDDAVLFSSFALLRDNPFVITVYGFMCAQEPRYGIRSDVRRKETEMAVSTLGCSHTHWDIPEDPSYEKSPNSEVEVEQAMRSLEWPNPPELVWAPLVEKENGHVQHDTVGRVAERVFGDRVRFYATYARGSGRTRTDYEAKAEDGWHFKKFRAMSFYESQINLPTIRPWFASDWDREWIS